MEAQFYLLSPLLMWAAFSPAACAPRRWGVFGLAAASLVGVAINLGLMLGEGESAFTMPQTWPPTFQYVFVVTRSPPYIAGMLAALVAHRTQRLPVAAPDPASGAKAEPADAASPGGEKGEQNGSVDAEVAIGVEAAAPLAGAKLTEAAPRRCLRRLRAWARAAPWLDWLALALCCGFAYAGTGMNM